MNQLIDFLKKHLFFDKEPRQTPEELQALFRARYRKFRALLTANNIALEAMAEMEQALQSNRTFSMAFIRSRSTAVMVNVYKMVQCLIDMSDGKYKGLEKAFQEISNHVDSILEQEPVISTGDWILPLAKINKNYADQVGEKMANLGEVSEIKDVLTPPGFAITAAATRYFLASSNISQEINRRLQILDHDDLESLYETSAEIQKLISNSMLPGDLEELIYDNYKILEEATVSEVKVAMRSSALGEDLAGASFAGQYHSELNVDKEFLGQVYKEIVASKHTSRAIIYRLKKGYSHEDIEMCVGCLAMVDAVLGGVVYSRDPAVADSTWVNINVASGTAEHVVDGKASTDLFLVSRQVPHKIIKKELQRGELAGQTLLDDQAITLAQIAVNLEDHFGSPQDIEWSIDRQGNLYILQSRPMMIVAGDEEKQPSPDHPEPDKDPSVRITGRVTGSSGAGCGPVFLVRNVVDMLQFPKNAVLVVAHPLPEWAPLLNKAVALIAETGSEAGHLATVSREFGIPALFGVTDALKELNNGEVLTVDASSRKVYSGRREDILANAPKSPDLMSGSPVQCRLIDVLKHISPLNLTDPGSPYFKSTECKTLHDITRFCHEKSVSEMFSFGEKHHFDKRAAKRLVGDVPLEWWVIDLADGFSENVDSSSKTVQLSEIVSTPMIAIWQGISAFPWQGPPPVNVKGMGSILFQSTMQPGLDPAVASAMIEQNHFMISKNFCNLSVRLGYHLAMLEAYLSDLLTESYVNFTFKGGAADDRRKVARIQLLSDVLSQYDFRIELKGDSLTARVERRPIEFLKDRLKILGYLTLHARQIDMVMGNHSSIQQYKKKFLADINTMMKSSENER
ncbi:MAG: pyruvate, water dikinase [Deltaproteobacteria bacterium]|nr:pyruvate, water dikinase [Deltaproteobacteria bacterium]